MLSSCPLILKFSNPFICPLGIVPNAPITISYTVTFTFHSFISSLATSMHFTLITYNPNLHDLYFIYQIF